MKTKGRTLLMSVCALVCCFSCIEKDNLVGGDYITTSQLFDIYSADIPIENIEMRLADSLTGYSQNRIGVGAIRDSEYGLSKRGCALTLVPVQDTLDFGTNPKFKSFHFAAALDTISVADKSQENILQNINVYALTERAGYPDYNINTTSLKYDPKRITEGVPVVNGKDSLSFNFTEEFGKRYLEITQADLDDSLSHYLKKFPGIYITCEDPVGNGGRFNFFELGMAFNKNYYYVTGSTASLSFESTYNGVKKDTAFLFYFGPPEFDNLDSLVENSTLGSVTFEQYCFNTCYQETRSLEMTATDKILIEGGGGLKPVITAAELKRLVEAEISANGDPSKTIITKASIELPFEFPEDYKEMFKWPQYLTPVCKLKEKNIVAYTSITDANNSQYESIGKINRSTLVYSPDISFHLQGILRLEDESKLSNLDVWLLIMRDEVTVTSGQSYADTYSSALNQMYYYNMMNGMYGGYGSYGYGYGSGYSSYGYQSYYNYMMMMSMYSSISAATQSTSSVSTKVDKDRYYCASLNGPQASTGRVPLLRLTYAIPKK